MGLWWQPKCNAGAGMVLWQVLAIAAAALGTSCTPQAMLGISWHCFHHPETGPRGAQRGGERSHGFKPLGWKATAAGWHPARLPSAPGRVRASLVLCLKGYQPRASHLL